MGALDLVTWWPVDAAAGGVLRRPGATDGAPADTVGDVERPFAWASLTKLLVAMAVMVAAEEGTISLDDPVGPPGSTVRHLLAHASGLGPDSRVPVAGPGRMRIYSNVGYEILAEVVAERARMAFADYLAGGVLTPLHMTGTELAFGASPASGAQGPLSDLLALAAEVLHPSLVSAATMTEATAVAFPGLRGVLPGYGRYDPCDWGLGFEVKGTKEPHWTGSLTSPATFGHFGRAGGFLWIDPVTGLACATLSNREFGPWAVDEWATLADAVVAEYGSSAAPVTRIDRERRQHQIARAEAAAEAEAARIEAEAARAAAEAEAEEQRRQRAEADERQARQARATAEAEQRELQAALARAEAAEAERRERLAADNRAAEAAAEAAEAERRERLAAENRAAEAAAEAAEAERRERLAAENRAAEAAAQAAAAGEAAARDEWRRRQVAETERREAREAAEAEKAQGWRPDRPVGGGGRAAAMDERRDSVEVAVGDVTLSEPAAEEYGPLGPGIRPGDFWGV
jgi:hypothetical protein